MNDKNILLHMTYDWHQMDNYVRRTMPSDKGSYRLYEFELVPYDNYSIEHEYILYRTLYLGDRGRNSVSIPIVNLGEYI